MIGCAARWLLRTSAPTRTPPSGSSSIPGERQPGDVDQFDAGAHQVDEVGAAAEEPR